jgi:hypothetical protein
VIEDVPPGTSRADVAVALEGASAGRRWAPGVVIGTTLLPEHRSGELEGVDRPERIAWAKLNPESVRLSLRVAGPDHALLVRTALRSGQPVQAWCLEHLLTAARGELEN